MSYRDDVEEIRGQYLINGSDNTAIRNLTTTSDGTLAGCKANGHTLICFLNLKEALGCGAFCTLFALLVWMEKNRQGLVPFPDFFG